ncbi:hypothetical protein KBB96_10255 [Luteolibacter ambystomatis]|uniref:DUF2238 domain-containing protein n=1 Tax=Luteolibacter ambystomatis TaxID=2824561 RepID=A0A975G6P0_9BACT|nr:hypothetical protein [Luteolibacter ambystomatis]QUE49255.1 hypothetical protein KBB96_10255 [Luteolibacter ambystomatis]
MNKPNPANPGPVFAFTGTYIAAFVAVSLATGTAGLPSYLSLMGVLVPSLYFLHRNYSFSAGLMWSFSVWGLLHMAGGLVPIPDGWFHEGIHPILYNWWFIPGYLKYDHVVHAYGFGITTWLCWHILKIALRSPGGSRVQPTPIILILCMAGGMGFGAFNEVVEFIFTLVMPDTNVGDYTNIGWDLVANLIGALVAVAIISHGDKCRP